MRISYDKAAYIMGYKNSHFGEKYLCIWKLDGIDGVGYSLICTIKIWAYIILFIPTHIMELFRCLWDGGLKDFRIFNPSEKIHHVICFKNEDGMGGIYDRAREVMED